MPVIQTQELVGFMEHWDRYKNTYFWSPPGSAPDRRRYEKSNSRSLEGEFFGHRVIAAISIDCSCKNIYAIRQVNVDGKKGTLRTLKSLLKKYNRHEYDLLYDAEIRADAMLVHG